MRELYLTCPVVRGPGGIATYSRSLVEALAPDPVSVLGQGTSADVAELPGNAKFLGSPVTQAAYAARLAFEYVRRPPTVFLFSHVGLTIPLAVLPRRRDHKVVLIGHGDEIWPRLSARRRAGLTHVDCAVFTTKFNRALFMASNGRFMSPDATTKVIALSGGRRFEAMRPFSMPGGARKRVVCVTRLTSEEPLKGMTTLIAAARHLPPEWDVVVVGDGDGRPGFEELARKSGVTDRIRFTGWLSDDDRTREFEQANVFCLPSAQEGFGIVFLEAMLAGRPCVGAAAGSVPEVLPPEASELFPFDDDVALAAAIVRLNGRVESGAVTPESVRKAYDDRYTWAQFQSRWREYIGTLR